MMERYIVWCPDLGQEQEDGLKITASGTRQAVEDWAEWHDNVGAEYSIVGGKDATVTVMSIKSGDKRDWIVSGESMPIYRARPAATPNDVAQGREHSERPAGAEGSTP
jgi:hypothetical protein